MPDIIITEFMDRAAIDTLAADFSLAEHPELAELPAHFDSLAQPLATALANARALIVRNRTQVGEALLAHAPLLEVVGRLGVGLDNIDLEACARRGIEVCPASGANNLAVAEYVVGTMMMLRRGAYAATAAVMAGGWPRTELMGRETAGARLGLVGFGAIAREAAAMARHLGVSVAASDPFVAADDPAWAEVERMELPQLLAWADVLSLHVPLSPETANLIDAQAIARMRKGAILINAARGGVLDEKALATAMRSGHIGGAAIDVFAEEPLDATRGEVFAGCRNLVLTPHIAGVSVEANVRVSALTAHNVRRVLQATVK